MTRGAGGVEGAAPVKGATLVGEATPVLPPADPFVWKITPLAGDFNPGTKLGQDIFHRKTKGLDGVDHLDLTKKNSQNIHSFFTA